MISAAIRASRQEAAVWFDEGSGPLQPRNIYGVTKLAAEQLCRLAHDDHGLPVLVLRTGRFFPEEDNGAPGWSGENLKANELLNRRLTVEDAVRAHLAALARAPGIGFGTHILSAPTPFRREDAIALRQDAAAVVARYFPDAPALYAKAGWTLPATIDRVYDAGGAGAGLPRRDRFRNDACRLAGWTAVAGGARSFLCLAAGGRAQRPVMASDLVALLAEDVR